jgi:hypothetical protein
MQVFGFAHMTSSIKSSCMKSSISMGCAVPAVSLLKSKLAKLSINDVCGGMEVAMAIDDDEEEEEEEDDEEEEEDDFLPA